jgi:hypothetical protein
MPYIPPTVNDYERRPVSPLSDPHGSGLLGHSGAPLMGRIPKPPSARDMGIPSSSGSSGIPGGSLGGGGGGSFDFDPRELAEDLQAKQESGEGEENEAPARPPIVNDADDPVATRGGIFTGSDGNLHHITPAPMTGPSSGGSAGFYARHVGAPGDGAI